MGVGCEYLLELLTKFNFLLEAELIYSCTVIWTSINSLDGPLIRTVHSVVVQCLKLNCLKQIAFALKSRLPGS